MKQLASCAAQRYDIGADVGDTVLTKAVSRVLGEPQRSSLQVLVARHEGRRLETATPRYHPRIEGERGGVGLIEGPRAAPFLRTVPSVVGNRGYTNTKGGGGVQI